MHYFLKKIYKGEMNKEKKLLCMDLLNYSDKFFNFSNRSAYDYHGSVTNHVDFRKDVKSARTKVMAFVKAASHSNIKVECFIDRSRKETKKSWEERKIDECNSGIRTAPVGLAVILGTIFQEFNVKVHYSTIDCDDTVAAFAYHKGGYVLSRDSDFFRYFVDDFTGTPPYKIYYGFSVKTLKKGGTHLKLICRDGRFNEAKGGPKSICNELPK